MMNITFNVKTEYFRQIEAGEKVYEYRLRNPYWTRRLEGRQYATITVALGYPGKDDDSKRMMFPYRGVLKTRIRHPHFGPDSVEVYAIPVFNDDVLCFIDHKEWSKSKSGDALCHAYFTYFPTMLNGVGWDDVPYEETAEIPWDKLTTRVVSFYPPEGAIFPYDGRATSLLSANSINTHGIPWLRDSQGKRVSPRTFSGFTKWVEDEGGTVLRTG